MGATEVSLQKETEYVNLPMRSLLTTYTAFFYYTYGYKRVFLF